jgi:predicted transcriptional regulator
MNDAPVLEHLKKFGQLLDSEIATGTALPLPKVRSALSELVERGQIATCKVTRFTDGKPVEAMLCRISGYIPPAAPGPKKTK